MFAKTFSGNPKWYSYLLIEIHCFIFLTLTSESAICHRRKLQTRLTGGQDTPSLQL